MVNGPRRRPSNYSLNIRHHGYSIAELRRARRYRRFSVVLRVIYEDNPSEQLRILIIMCLLVVRNVTGNRIAENPIFIRQPRLHGDFSDAQLYNMRIRSRAHIPRLLAGLLIPAVIICENGTLCSGEQAFLMLIYWFSMPRLLSSAQCFFGIEYSQFSRIIKATIRFIITTWRHLIEDNFDFFAVRFPLYNNAIRAKYLQLNDGIMDPRYENVATFTDGTQRQHNRDRRSNFSGHKRYYCLGYLVTNGPDGMIVDVSGAFAGRKPDHMKQNESNISGRLVDCQVGNLQQFDTSTDKGMFFI
jgi:hypothetical protein